MSTARASPPPAAATAAVGGLENATITTAVSSSGSVQKRRTNNLSIAKISIPLQGLNILKRKPLPTNSPIHQQQRSASVDSPKAIILRQPPLNTLTPIASPGLVVRDLDQNPHGTTPLVQAEPTPSSLNSQNVIFPLQPLGSPGKGRLHSRNSSAPAGRVKPRHDRHTSTRSAITFLADPSDEEDNSNINASPRNRTRIMTSFSTQHGTNLLLRIDSDLSQDNNGDPLAMPTTPRSPPTRKLSNLFGWKKSPGPESPSTLSGHSQPVSPMPQGTAGGYFGARLAPTVLDIPKANALHTPYFTPGTPGLPSPPISTTNAADLEQELRELSSELANSLRRELELEDDLERSRSARASLETGRRTSDYFSDCGAGSIRYPGENDGKIEQLERLRRAAEQDKAQLKVEMSEKLQAALQRRREAEEKTVQLHERLKFAGVPDTGSQNPKELKMQLEETKRRLSEESQFRQNFQDLVGGMRLELEQLKNQRDNLRDEVVPQLRSRIEGLESESARNQSMTYEHSRMSQELQSLKAQSKDRMLDIQGGRFVSIDEEEKGLPSPSSPSIGGLSRSKSFAVRGGRGSRTNSIIGTAGLTRAASVKDISKVHESREVLTQKVKDAETQRDALHKALKSLLDRHLVQEKKHVKKVTQLENDLKNAQALTPRRTVFHEEVKLLKDEITTLRRRADDAMDQKWQLEKNFSGVKMDLDRAQQNTTSARALLEQYDLFLPERPGSRDGSQALDMAYEGLRTTHALSIAHIKDMELGSDSNAAGSSEKTLQLLKQSISNAEAERNLAQSQAEEYRQQARNLQRSEIEHLGKAQSLSAELFASAQRMDDLANQAQSQIQSNSVLRQKLAEAIEFGEREQKDSTFKISQMQGKLRDLEDKLMAAQQQSEEVISSHEEEVKELQDAHNAQLQRTKAGCLTSASGTQPSSPMNGLFARKSTQINRVSLAEASKTGPLQARVKELERALNDAEQEMGEVVSRMNKAQMAVADLQSERDDAMMQSRRLQAEYLKEREMVQKLMGSA